MKSQFVSKLSAHTHRRAPWITGLFQPNFSVVRLDLIDQRKISQMQSGEIRNGLFQHQSKRRWPANLVHWTTLVPDLFLLSKGPSLVHLHSLCMSYASVLGHYPYRVVDHGWKSVLWHHPVNRSVPHRDKPDRPVRGLYDVTHTDGLWCLDLLNLAQRRP